MGKRVVKGSYSFGNHKIKNKWLYVLKEVSVFFWLNHRPELYKIFDSLDTGLNVWVYERPHFSPTPYPSPTTLSPCMCNTLRPFERWQVTWGTRGALLHPNQDGPEVSLLLVGLKKKIKLYKIKTLHPILAKIDVLVCFVDK